MRARRPALIAILIVAACLAACRAADPRERVLEERALWKVQLLDWAVREDGTVSISARVSGPPSSSLERLTVRLVLQDAAGSAVGHEWHTLDLTGIQRGGPEDVTLRLAGREGPVEGIGIDPVLAPTPEESAHIPELQL